MALFRSRFGRRSVAARENAICVRCGRPGDEGCLESSDFAKTTGVFIFYVLRKVWCCSACTPCQGFPASLNTAVFNFNRSTGRVATSDVREESAAA